MSSDLLTQAAAIVAARLKEDAATITGPRKGAPSTAFARQAVAYLLNTEADLDKQAVGTLLGRHRSTIGNAVEVVEDYRATSDGGVIDELCQAFRSVLPAKPRALAPTRRMADPLTSVITSALVERGLFRAGDSLTTEREGSRVKINIVLRVNRACSRAIDEAHDARRQAIATAEKHDYGLIFSDVMYAHKGTTGWSITLRFRQSARL
jgi:hypothetical protein